MLNLLKKLKVKIKPAQLEPIADIQDAKPEPTAKHGCPACGSLYYYEGPGAGSAIKVKCARCGRIGTVIFGGRERWL